MKKAHLKLAKELIELKLNYSQLTSKMDPD
jgi:hypothetical protein